MPHPLRSWLCSLALVAGPLAAVAAAAPAEPEVTYEVQPSGQLVATVSGGGLGRVHTASLRDDQGHRVTPTSQVSFVDGDEPVALVLVVSGWEVWMGNEDLTSSHDPSRYYGALHGLERALDELDLAHTLPRGSTVAIVRYSDHTTISPWLPSATFSGAALGTQKDYYNHLGIELVAGVETGLAALERAPAPRKALFVLGDGVDTNPETAHAALRLDRKRAASDGIGLGALVYKTPLSEPSSVIYDLVPRAQAVSSTEAFGPALAAFVAAETAGATLTFPLADLPSDGRPHDLTLTLDGRDLDSETVTMPAPPPSPWPSAWWLQLGAGVLGVGLLAAITRWRSAAAA